MNKILDLILLNSEAVIIDFVSYGYGSYLLCYLRSQSILREEEKSPKLTINRFSRQSIASLYQKKFDFNWQICFALKFKTENFLKHELHTIVVSTIEIGGVYM